MSPPITEIAGHVLSQETITPKSQAFRLHIQGLLWSNRMLLDGQLAKEDMSRWAHHPEAAPELVERVHLGGPRRHYQIIHHIGYQRTAKEVIH
jgi:hypothetical protein